MNIQENCYNLLSLEGKVVAISGASSGIGRGTAVKLAQYGGKIILFDVNANEGMKVQEEIIKIGGNSFFIKCDVTDAVNCKNAVDTAVRKYGKIDVLFNNAGIAVRKNAVDLEPGEWDLALNVSLKGQYLLSKYVIPKMKQNGGGSIINTGSGWSLRGGENAVAYCAMKGGTLNMTRAMCLDHGKDNIRVNTVCPGDIDTPMLQSECEQLGGIYNDDYKNECGNRPISRLGTPEDVANAVLFFASDMSSWISGAHLVVDGGGIAG